MKRFLPLFLLVAVTVTPMIYYGWNAPSSFREEQQKWIQHLQKEKYMAEDEDLEEEDLEEEDRESPRMGNWAFKDNSLLAYNITEDWVKQRLKAPSTAEFPGIFDGKADHIQRLDDNKYRIHSWVDAQNAFGAQIRTHWEAVVQQTGEYDWKLFSLKIE